MNKFFRSLLLPVLVISFSTSAKIGIVVNENLYPYIQRSVNTYISDLGTIENKQVWLNTTFTANNSVEELRDSLRVHYADDSLEGVVFIGDLPFFMIEYMTPVSPYQQIPTDLYFMDLDAEWYDHISEAPYQSGLVDGYTSDHRVEIWVSRITASTLSRFGTERNLVSQYFARVHDRMIGNSDVPRRALLTTRWDFINEARDANFNTLGYNSRTLKTLAPEELNNETFSRELQRGVEFAHIITHSGPATHWFEHDVFTTNDLLNMISDYKPPKIQFITFAACNVAKYNEENLASLYALTGKGLVTVGASSTGGFSFQKDFYETPLKNGQSFGEAVKNYLNNENIYNMENLVICGVGTLKLTPYSVQNMLLNTATPSLNFPNTVTGTQNTKTVVFKNAGTSATTISSAVITDSVFQIVTPSSWIVNAKDSLVLSIKYNPAAEGIDTASLIIKSNAVNYPEISVSLNGFGKAPLAENPIRVRLQPDQNNIGSSFSPSITVVNTSNQSIDLSQYAIDYYMHNYFFKSEIPNFVLEESPEDISKLIWNYYYCDKGRVFTIAFSNTDRIIYCGDYQANQKFTISFNVGTILNPNDSIKMQFGITTSDYSYTFNQSDDYSNMTDANGRGINVVVREKSTGTSVFGYDPEVPGMINYGLKMENRQISFVVTYPQEIDMQAKLSLINADNGDTLDKITSYAVFGKNIIAKDDWNYLPAGNYSISLKINQKEETSTFSLTGGRFGLKVDPYDVVYGGEIKFYATGSIGRTANLYLQGPNGVSEAYSTVIEKGLNRIYKYWDYLPSGLYRLIIAIPGESYYADECFFNKRATRFLLTVTPTPVVSTATVTFDVVENVIAGQNATFYLYKNNDDGSYSEMDNFSQVAQMGTNTITRNWSALPSGNYHLVMIFPGWMVSAEDIYFTK